MAAKAGRRFGNERMQWRRDCKGVFLRNGLGTTQASKASWRTWSLAVHATDLAAFPEDNMHRIPTAAIGAAAIVAMTTSLAFAGTTGNGSGSGKANVQDLHLRIGSHAGRCIVTLHLGSGPVSWAYDPATGTITQLPEVVENTNPNSGIGVVVKKNPGSSAARLIGDLDGTTFDVPAATYPGNYDIVSRSRTAINTKGTGALAEANRRNSTQSRLRKSTEQCQWTPGRQKRHTTDVPCNRSSPPQDQQQQKLAGVPRTALQGCHKTRDDPRRITIDSSRPPTVAVGSGTSSSQ